MPDSGNTGKAGLLLGEEERLALWESLTERQQVWYLTYLTNGFNATEAAREAGYKAESYSSLTSAGYQNRHHPTISRLLEDALHRHLMSENEALARMSNIAESDLSNFVDEVTATDGTTRRVPSLDKGIENGAGSQLKEISMEEEEFVNSRGRLVTKRKTKIKLHDPKPALDTLLRAHGKLGSGDDGAKVNVNVQVVNQYWQDLEAEYGAEENY